MADEKQTVAADICEERETEDTHDTNLLSSVPEPQLEIPSRSLATTLDDVSHHHGSSTFPISANSNSLQEGADTVIRHSSTNVPAWTCFENHLQNQSSGIDFGSTSDLNKASSVGESRQNGYGINEMSVSTDALRSKPDLKNKAEPSLSYYENAQTVQTDICTPFPESTGSKVSITEGLPSSNSVSTVFTAEPLNDAIASRVNSQGLENANLLKRNLASIKFNDSRTKVIDSGNYSSGSAEPQHCGDSTLLPLQTHEAACVPDFSGMSPSGFSSQPKKESDSGSIRHSIQPLSGKGDNSKLKKRPVLSPCNCTGLMCIDKIPNKRREILHSRFWNLRNFSLQRQWVCDHVLYKQKQTAGSKPLTKFQCSIYYMPDEAGNLKQVCRNFFLRTLGFRSHKIISRLMEQTHLVSKAGKRGSGRHMSENVRRVVIMHIKSYLKRQMKSHCQQQSIFDFALLKLAFQSFVALYPALRIPLYVFRQIFYTIRREILGKVSHVSPLSLFSRLRKAYTDHYYRVKKKSEVIDDRIQGLDKCNDDSLSLSSTGTRVDGSFGGKEAKGETEQGNEDNRVVMHLGIENDDIIITKNASDSSDTEVEGDPIETVKDQRNTKQHYKEKETVLSDGQNSEFLTLVHKHPLLSPCTCKSQCDKKLTEEKRHEIHSIFWSLGGYKSQKQWILRHVQGICSCRTPAKNVRVTIQYFLPDTANSTVQVCPVYFYRTLGIKSFKKGSVRNRRRQKWADLNIDSNTRRIIELFISDYSSKMGETSREQWNSSFQKQIQKTKMSLIGVYKEFLKSYPQHSVSFIAFRKIHQSIICVPLQTSSSAVSKPHSPVSHLKVKSARNVRKASRPQPYADEPLKRRRSSRTTRMQGSMAEDILLELGGESNMVSSIVSTHEKSQTAEDSRLLMSESALDLSPPKRKVSRTSELLLDGVQSRKTKAANVSASKTVKGAKSRKSTDSPQPAKKRGRKKGGKNTVKSGAKKAMKESKQSNKGGKRGGKGKKTKEDVVSNNEDYKFDKGDEKEKKRSSKKHYKLNSLRKKHKHPILPSCDCSRRNCIQQIPEERRKEIYESFWNLSSYKDRKRWLLKYVEKRQPKSRTLSLFPQRQNESKRYFLPSSSGTTEEVCRLFFIHTLGFRWDSVIDMIVRNKKSSKIISRKEETVKKPPRQLPDYITNSVKQYLESVRSNAEPTTTKEGDNISQAGKSTKTKPTPQKVKELFADYKVQYKSLNFNLGYHSFRRILRSVVDPSYESDEPEENGSVDNDRPHEDNNEDDAAEDVEHNESKLVTGPEKKKKGPKLKKDDAKNGSVVPTEASKIRKFKASNDNGKSSTEELDNEKNISADNNSPEIYFSEDDQSKEARDGSHSINKVTDGDECILDVGSGYFKRTPGVSASDNPVPPTSDAYKYKKRRSQSLRNDRKNYPVLPPCKCAKRRCSNKYTAAQRQAINDMFWTLDGYNCRKQWILEHIKRGDIKRRVAQHHGHPRKLESRWYFLPHPEKNEELIEVCKAFFLRTLGYRWDSVIDTIGKTTPKGTNVAAPDKRGRKPPPHKITEEAVNSMTRYIESVCQTYQPLYQPKSQPRKKGNKSGTSTLVPYGLTMKQLFEDYKSKHPNHRFGYESFRKIFRRVHGAILASQPPLPEPEPVDLEESFSGDQGYNEASEEVVDRFQHQESSMVPTTDSYVEIGSYASPAPPAPLPPPQQHQEHPQLFGNMPERQSCLYQYGAPGVEHPHHAPHQSMHMPESGTSGPDLYSHVEHDPYVKYSHNLYGPPPGAGHQSHFPQMTDSVGFVNNSNNSRTEVMDPSVGVGQNQFPSYFMSNPEPLRHQVYQMASQYQTILHHIAESSRFLNYPGFPAADGTYQGGQDKMYHYRNRPDFPRESLNSYNVPKSSQNCGVEAIPTLNQYAPLTHMSQTSLQHEPANMVVSQSCEKKENGFVQDSGESENSCLEQEQDLKVNFESVLSSDKTGKRKRAPKKGTPKKVKNDKPKVPREKKPRPKSLRNYGDHYPMLPACHCRKKNCNEKFSEEKRQKIHDMFWDLKGYNERKQWMLQNIKRENCKRRRIDQHESFRKLESRWYFFPTDDGSKVEVCKDFFLKTLGYKWDSVIDTIRRTTPKGETSVRPDQRGKKPPAHKLSGVVLRSVVQYIKSMQQASKPFSPDIENPNCDLEAQGRESSSSSSNTNSYNNNPNTNENFTGPVSIPYGLTMKDLFDDYKVKHATHKIGYESFRRIFRALSNPEKEIDGRSVYKEILNSEESSELLNF